MTLILYIPYSEGCFLLGDRQRSKKASNLKEWDGYKDEFTKLYLFKEIGLAIGCAGNLEIIESFFDKLKKTKNPNNKNYIKILRKLFACTCSEYLNALRYTNIIPHFCDLAQSVEMIIVKLENGIIMANFYHITPKAIDKNKMYAIPSLNRNVRRYLNKDTLSLSKDEVILVGEEILRQIAFSNALVGPPEYHGYDLVNLTYNGECCLSNIEPSLPRYMSSSELRMGIKLKEE